MRWDRNSFPFLSLPTNFSDELHARARVTIPIIIIIIIIIRKRSRRCYSLLKKRATPLRGSTPRRRDRPRRSRKDPLRHCARAAPLCKIRRWRIDDISITTCMYVWENRRNHGERDPLLLANCEFLTDLRPYLEEGFPSSPRLL